MPLVQIFNRASILALLVLTLHAPVVHSEDNPPNLVALFGDSISYGFNRAFPSREEGGGRLNRGFPSIFLDQILTENNRVSLVSNLGVGGSASGPSTDPELFSNNGVRRINSDLGRIRVQYSPTKANYALIMYGTNDPAYSISATTTGFNIQVLIEDAIRQGFIPVVGTIPPCVCADVLPINNRIREAVQTQQQRGLEVYLVDHYSNLLPNWPALVDPDGVHPNNDGYFAIAQFWFDGRLKELIALDPSESPEPKPNLNGVLLLLLDDDE